MKGGLWPSVFALNICWTSIDFSCEFSQKVTRWFLIRPTTLIRRYFWASTILWWHWEFYQRRVVFELEVVQKVPVLGSQVAVTWGLNSRCSWPYWYQYHRSRAFSTYSSTCALSWALGKFGPKGTFHSYPSGTNKQKSALPFL